MTLARSALGAVAAAALAACLPAAGQSLTNVAFVNGITIAGDTPDLTGGSSFDRRVGFFSVSVAPRPS